MTKRQHVRTAQSCAADARDAVREFHAAVAQPSMGLVVFFCSSGYDLEALAAEMHRLFPDTPVVGCTTAGEIGPAGYRENSLAGASFAQDAIAAATGLLEGVRNFEMAQGQTFVQALLQRLEALGAPACAANSFAFLLIDGLSTREEPVTWSLQNALGRIRMFGGSAGDRMAFSATHVYHAGRFHSDSAALILATTRLPFRIFKTQHFVSTEQRLVVTEADTERRIVREINGLPAAAEYARLVGADVDALDAGRFAASPLVVVIDGAEYVRSIQKANPDGSLTFYCAIDEGLVLRVARGEDLVRNLENAFRRVEREIGMPQVVFGCDCILRSLEISQGGLKERVAEVFRHYNTIGFNTYGEQFGGVHVNQTLTALAIGSPGERGDE